MFGWLRKRHYECGRIAGHDFECSRVKWYQGSLFSWWGYQYVFNCQRCRYTYTVNGWKALTRTERLLVIEELGIKGDKQL